MKHTDDVYLVVREDISWPKPRGQVHVCGVYSNLELADRDAAKYNQSWKDRGWDGEARFNVIVSTFHDR